MLRSKGPGKNAAEMQDLAGVDFRSLFFCFVFRACERVCVCVCIYIYIYVYICMYILPVDRYHGDTFKIHHCILFNKLA
jgi:hypothetical protein